MRALLPIVLLAATGMVLVLLRGYPQAHPVLSFLLDRGVEISDGVSNGRCNGQRNPGWSPGPRDIPDGHYAPACCDRRTCPDWMRNCKGCACCDCADFDHCDPACDKTHMCAAATGKTVKEVEALGWGGYSKICACYDINR